MKWSPDDPVFSHFRVRIELLFGTEGVDQLCSIPHSYESEKIDLSLCATLHRSWLRKLNYQRSVPSEADCSCAVGPVVLSLINSQQYSLMLLLWSRALEINNDYLRSRIPISNQFVLLFSSLNSVRSNFTHCNNHKLRLSKHQWLSDIFIISLVPKWQV